MSNLKKLLLFGGIIVVALFLALYIQKPEEITTPTPVQLEKELKLSDFHEVFKENALIVIGDKASEIELQAVNEIADYLENETGNKPLVKKYSKINDEDKKNNLIIVGTPNSNPMLKEVYTIADVLEVNESFPGEGKGVLEILGNPWEKDKAMLLVEGWDGFGIESASWLLQNKQLNKNKVIFEWENTMAWIDEKRGIALILNDEYILVLNDEYILGEEIEIKIKNFGTKDFEVEGRTGTCYDFQVFNLKGEELPINEPNCELYEIYREPYSIRPNETKVIGKWDQKIYHNNVKKLIQLGKYVIRAFGLEKMIIIKEVRNE